ncbi:hypothetical protein R4R77_004684 [Citrobacter amalonaticus]|uniref:Uncharacterized protein n=3 Tax=Citrobacter TaxID=544 RepID=A0ABY0HNB5_CITAM|nr:MULTISPECIES: hypothetical protein [Citrobacter]EHK0944127.1 hypothetical protein [Citrobacter farmeri]AMG53235.1 hypothetical protein AL524_09125 [Citrobacter amalonaticus]AMG53756.1 hypothetical protein AL524_12000 [Citrobacter amalonaticus]AMG54770.1 hypothetical protein AL524_17625 [Citrobacter amalonaticus]EKX4539483.1 hypothetical protein [Citrobacter farmeri]
MSGTCIIDGCGRHADKIIGVRLRRELDNLSAIWAHNTNAYLCDEHAAMGFDVEVTFTPRDDKTIRTSVSDGRGSPVVRLREITKPVNPGGVED